MANEVPAAQPGPVNRGNAEHYRWGDNCDAWYLVNDEQLSIIEELMPPGAAEIRHHHQKAEQFFYILTGEVLMEVEGETTLLSAGSGIRVLRGKTSSDSQSVVRSSTFSGNLPPPKPRGSLQRIMGTRNIAEGRAAWDASIRRMRHVPHSP